MGKLSKMVENTFLFILSDPKVIFHFVLNIKIIELSLPTCVHFMKMCYHSNRKGDKVATLPLKTFY